MSFVWFNKKKERDRRCWYPSTDTTDAGNWSPIILSHKLLLPLLPSIRRKRFWVFSVIFPAPCTTRGSWKDGGSQSTSTVLGNGVAIQIINAIIWFMHFSASYQLLKPCRYSRHHQELLQPAFILYSLKSTLHLRDYKKMQNNLKIESHFTENGNR